MALSSAIVWEVNGASGSDTNGGGFRAGASGTDKTQGAGLAVTVRTDLGGDATGNTLVPSVAPPSAAPAVGTGTTTTAGVGWTTGFYEITAFNAGTGQVTLDRSPAAAGATGGVGTVGGALATPGSVAKVSGGMVAGNTVWIRAG